MKWAIKIASLGMLVSSSISNLILLTQNYHYILNRYECTFIVWITICLLLLLVVIIEPEKLKNYTAITTALVISVCASFAALNYIKYITSHSNVAIADIPLFNISNTFSFTGNLIYAFELSSCYFSLRLTARPSIDYGYLTSISMVIIMLTYYTIGVSFMLAFKDKDMHENAFRNFDSGILRHASLIFAVNTVYNFITNTIFACEAFETNGWIRVRLVDA